MSAKRKSKQQASDASTIRIGTRVRCTDDGVEGRITWANAVALKIKWDDGEEVTWKREALATRPIEVIEEATSPPVHAETPTEAPSEQMPTCQADSAAVPTEQQVEAVPTGEQPTPDATAIEPVTAEMTDHEAQQQAAPAPTGEATAAEQPAGLEQTTAATPAMPKRVRKPKSAAEPKEKKVSALDAAVRVLAEAGTPLTCQQMIEQMAQKGYWTSPGGKTPAATLYSAILREIGASGAEARFKKTDRGQFAVNQPG